MTDSTITRITIRNEPTSMFTRFRCHLCGGGTDKQSYLFEVKQDVPGLAEAGAVVCDDCAQHPEDIPARQRARAEALRAEAAKLDAAADQCEYVTEVAPHDPDNHECQPWSATPEYPGDLTPYQCMYSAEDYADWMRDHLGLPRIPRCARCESRFTPTQEESLYCSQSCRDYVPGTPCPGELMHPDGNNCDDCGELHMPHSMHMASRTDPRDGTGDPWDEDVPGDF